MKALQRIFIVFFCILLVLPMAFFNFKSNVVSEIDNRRLTEFPVGENHDPEKTVTAELQSYVSDRIGFRDNMIEGYTLFNDAVFGEMIHPSYMYGKDGYIFSRRNTNVTFGSFHKEFAQAVIKMNEYCKARGVPFLFVFEPEKSSVCRDKLPKGFIHNNNWVKSLLKLLDEAGVPYVDNTEILIQKYSEAEQVFNIKYNAGHWNDLGAFYGVNNLLEELSELMSGVYINSQKEFTVTQKLNTSLQLSKYPIHEYEPIYKCITPVIERTELYVDELTLHPNYPYFYYTENKARKAEGAPRALVFQGSYMNGMGYKFLQNSFSEYIAVHDYQNVLEMDYYFGIFNPDCVIFEVAEYTFKNTYFDYDKMCELEFPPAKDELKGYEKRQGALSGIEISQTAGNALATVKISGLEKGTEYVYLSVNGRIYDCCDNTDGVFTAVLDNKNFDRGSLQVYAADPDLKIITEYR